MSKIAFISDIHGNYPAFQAVLSDIDNKKVDAIYCLGDLVGYYSQINEVIDAVRQRNIPAIMGNHDYALVYNKGLINRSKTCTKVLKQQLSYIKEDNFDFIKQLPTRIEIVDGDNRILCVHGGLNDNIDEYLPPLTDAYFSSVCGMYTHVITGHNHIAAVGRYGDIIYGNCGAVGQPRDYNPRASYLLYQDGLLLIQRVEYDINATKKAMQCAGFEDYISDVLYKGFRIGEK